MFANDPFCAVYYRMEGQNTSQNGAQARLERYVAMHQHAIRMLLPHADAAELTPGLTNGAHQVLAGMCALHDAKSPSLDKVKQHAEALLRALEAHGDVAALLAVLGVDGDGRRGVQTHHAWETPRTVSWDASRMHMRHFIAR